MNTADNERQRQKEHLRNQMIDGKRASRHPFAFLRHSRKNRILFLAIAAAAAAAVILAVFLYSALHTWSTYSVRWEIPLNNSSSADFAVVGDSVFKVGLDGVQCFSRDSGETLWVSSYSMEDPQVRVRGDYLLVYDAGGQSGQIFTEEGLSGRFTTPQDISMADLSESGMAVTILEGSDQSLVNYYARDGRKLDISVTIPEESAGYPLAMAISPDGTKLAVSCYVIQGAAASCLLTVYNFDADSAQTDHVEGSIDYADTDSFVPLLFFLTDEKLVTAADNLLDLITVQGGLSDRRTDLTGEVRRVFYGKDRIGLLVQDENGQHIDLYDDQCVFLRSLQEEETFDSYSFAGGDILMVSEDSIRIRSSSGLVRYAQQFRNPITDVVWAGESGRLYLAGENSLQSISLR